MVRAAKGYELAAWSKVDVSTQEKEGAPSKAAAASRRILPWDMVDGRTHVKARPVAKDYQDPVSKEGQEESPCCASLRSSHLQILLLGALKKWELCTVDVRNAFSQPDDFTREGYLRATTEWNARGSKRI